NNSDYGAATWTKDPGANENKPVSCVDWYTMFAFCAWDGGRLPTDAEWGYVGVSADEKRAYPYGNAAPTFDALKDVIVGALNNPRSQTFMFTYGPMFRSKTDGAAQIAPVGLKSERSKWGHADLTGNLMELTLDAAGSVPTTCNDCANVSWPDPPQTS